MRLEVVYPMHVKPGDFVAGEYVPNAPTRPVQPFANAMAVQVVENRTELAPEGGWARTLTRFDFGHEMLSEWHEAGSQVLVIRNN